MIEVKKVWGKEVWVVNNDKYCGKLLHLNAGATCSYHYHQEKQETFYCLEGDVWLTVEGEEFLLEEPYTIYPCRPHKFFGISNAVILEVSTTHREDDVVRLSDSKPKQ